MMFRLVQEYLGDEELQRIAGISPGLPTSQAEIQGAYDFAVKFDVRELDSDYVIGKMKAIIDLLPIDTAGTVDRAKLMSIAVSMVDPVLGQSVMSDQRGASQKTFDKVNQDVALMALGNEAAYTENDPTAAMKMQFMQQIVQGNPKYQEALQGDERFQALLENYGKNLQQSVTQEQNKMIGRIGVQPVKEEPSAMNEELRKKNLQQLDDASAAFNSSPVWQALKDLVFWIHIRGNRDECGQCDQ